MSTYLRAASMPPPAPRTLRPVTFHAIVPGSVTTVCGLNDLYVWPDDRWSPKVQTPCPECERLVLLTSE